MKTSSNHHYLGGSGVGVALQLADVEDAPSGYNLGVAVVASATFQDSVTAQLEVE